MRVYLDSSVDALAIDLVDDPRAEHGVEEGGGRCIVAIAGGRPVSIELFRPGDGLELLAAVAEQYGLDAGALEAAAGAALRAPDREVTLEVAPAGAQ